MNEALQIADKLFLAEEIGRLAGAALSDSAAARQVLEERINELDAEEARAVVRGLLDAIGVTA